MNHAQNTSIIWGFMEKMVNSSFVLTLKRYFLLITRMVVLFPTIIEDENDGYGGRRGARNDEFWKLTKMLLSYDL